MAYGTVATDVIQSSTTGTPTQFQDGSGTQIGTLCRAWVNFNGTSGASPVIRSSFNVSSVVRNGTGDYSVNFTTALTDANYADTYGATGGSSGLVMPFIAAASYATYKTNSLLRFGTYAISGTQTDSNSTSVAIFR